MSTTAVPLDDLAQHIARQQAELERLHQEYETRTTQLASLESRKAELESQLRQVEAEIQAVAQGNAASSPPAPSGAPQAALPAAPAASPSGGRQTLPALLVEIVRQAGQPLTARQLAEEVARRKFPTQSGNLPKLVDIRVRELIGKGILRRAKDGSGVVLARSVPKAAPRQADRRAPKSPARKTPTAKSPVRSVAKRPKGQPPLREVLAGILGKSKRPLGRAELGRQALASGYQSNSKNFSDVVGVMAGKIDNVEHIPGQGYRLKIR